MAIVGTFEVDGKVYKFRKPHVGPVMRFNDTIGMAQQDAATLTDVFKASLAVVHDAVARMDPTITREHLADSLDEDALREFHLAVMGLAGKKEAEPGEPARP